MKISLKPFPNSAWIKVPLTPLGYVLLVGKLNNQVPLFVPEEDFPITVFVDLPEGDPQEGVALIQQNLSSIQRLAAECLISPAPLDVARPWHVQGFEKKESA